MKKDERIAAVIMLMMLVIGIGLIVTSTVITWRYIGSLAMMRDSFWILIHEGHAGVAWGCAGLDVLGLIFIGIVRAIGNSGR